MRMMCFTTVCVKGFGGKVGVLGSAVHDGTASGAGGFCLLHIVCVEGQRPHTSDDHHPHC